MKNTSKKGELSDWHKRKAARKSGNALLRTKILPPTAEECRLMGIPEPMPGQTTCLRCGGGFYSPDIKKFRRCPQCRIEVRKQEASYEADEWGVVVR
jgi:hypothetical protein